MSYNTDLQNNNTSLQEILATVNSLPEAGGSSGGGVEIETCTVLIYGDSVWETGYYTTFEDGQIVTKTIPSEDTSITLDNVINNSMIGIKFKQSTVLSLTQLYASSDFHLIKVQSLEGRFTIMASAI